MRLDELRWRPYAERRNFLAFIIMHLSLIYSIISGLLSTQHLHAALFSLCVCPGYLYCHGGMERGSCPGSGFIPFSGYSCSPQLNSCRLSIIIIPVPLPLSLPPPSPIVPVAFFFFSPSFLVVGFCFVINACCRLYCPFPPLFFTSFL